MASSYSTDLSLELVATGEKAGLWGTITNTNLQLLQQAVSGYVEVTLSTGNVTLDLSDGSATANGKNLYIKVTGTLSGNASLTMPASTTGGNANRVFFVEDGTTRGTAAESWTVTLLTAGQAGATQVPLPEGATALVYSRGSVPATTLGMLEKGFTTVRSNKPILNNYVHSIYKRGKTREERINRGYESSIQDMMCSFIFW